MKRDAKPKAALVYDSDCGVCLNFKKTVEALDYQGRFEFVSLREEKAHELLARMPMQARMSSFHIVYPDGRIVSADDAVPHVVRLLPGGSVTYWLLKIPGMRPLIRVSYNWVRRNRHRLSKRKVCPADETPEQHAAHQR